MAKVTEQFFFLNCLEENTTYNIKTYPQNAKIFYIKKLHGQTIKTDKQ